VYASAAIYVRAPEPRQIEAALEEALFNGRARERVLAQAQSIVSRYSWAACAKQVLDALVRAAQGE
jgi:glycosyltransferase involved in cell wall biosynthesis